MTTRQQGNKTNHAVAAALVDDHLWDAVINLVSVYDYPKMQFGHFFIPKLHTNKTTLVSNGCKPIFGRFYFNDVLSLYQSSNHETESKKEDRKSASPSRYRLLLVAKPLIYLSPDFPSLNGSAN